MIDDQVIDHSHKPVFYTVFAVGAICRFRRFGPSSVDYKMMGWVEDPEFREQAVHFLNGEVYIAFEKSGIEIPYSKQHLYIKSLPDQD